MSAIKAMVLFCLNCAIIVSICSAQVAKSQSTSSSTSDTKQASGRSYTSGALNGGLSGTQIDPNNPYMNQVFSHKPFDLLHLVPILLILAFIPLMIPLILPLFAGAFAPFNFPHGRRRRDTNFHKTPETTQLLLDLAKKVGDSLQKFNEFSK